MSKKTILLLTLVHPDFLPPVYAIAQVLRDYGYNIHILTFDSPVPANLDIGDNIAMELMGKHHEANALDRIRLRIKFIKRAKQLCDEHTLSIITFCPFSFQCGFKIKKNISLMYIALEIADFTTREFLKSFLSNYRNYFTFKHLHKADFVATPSIKRSAWLAGRCHLDFMPFTILNTAYLQSTNEEDTLSTFKEIVPGDFLDKKIILYNGAVNTDHCILELVHAFDLVNDERSALIITGMKDNPYCNDIKDFIEKSKSSKRIKLFPYVTRKQMLSLQSNSHIGVCLTREYQNVARSTMIAPNKVGEYTSKNLYIIGFKSEYLRLFEVEGIASLASSPTPQDIGEAITESLKLIQETDIQSKIRNFVQSYFCMQYQLQHMIKFLTEIK
jgi:hypothetical protein